MASSFVNARAAEGFEVPLGENDFRVQVIRQLTQMSTRMEALAEVPEKLTRLETQMGTLLGNGQPGLIAKLDERIGAANAAASEVKIEQGRQRGIAAGISFCVAVVVSLVVALFKAAGK